MPQRRWSRIAARWIAWTAGLFWLALFFGLVDLSVPLLFQSRPEFYEGYLVSTGWGVLFTFFAGIPMCFLGARPEWASAGLISTAGGIAVGITAVVSGQPAQLAIAAGLVLPPAGAWLLSRRSGAASATRPSVRMHLPILALAVIALPPAIFYASEMIAAARAGRMPLDYTWGFDHWPIQAAAALVIPLATASLAFRLPGWRAMTLVVASGTAWIGATSVAYPHHAASWGIAWGATAVAWAVALALLFSGLPPRAGRRFRFSRPTRRSGRPQ